MSRRIAALVIMGISLGIGSAYAQESNVAPAAVEVTFMPAGAAYFTAKGDQPSFGNYGYRAGVRFNLNRFLAVEGRVRLDDRDHVRSAVRRSEQRRQGAEHAELHGERRPLGAVRPFRRPDAVDGLNAGFTFMWIAAVVAHYQAGDGALSLLPVALLGSLAVSYVTRSANRRGSPQHFESGQAETREA